MTFLRRVVDALIYYSVAFGVVLLLQLWFSVPRWLFYTVLAGWIAYFFTAIAIMRHHKEAYKVAILLAILTLVVSLPQPEHYAFVKEGITIASMTFIVGSALQLCITVLLAIAFLRHSL
jgi:hypothetical protein